MTTQDNQTVKITITMNTQTESGLNWQGSVEVTGPADSTMIEQVISLSDQLATEALSHRVAAIDAVGIIQNLPDRPKRRKRNTEEAIEKIDEVSDLMLGPDATEKEVTLDRNMVIRPLVNNRPDVIGAEGVDLTEEIERIHAEVMVDREKQDEVPDYELPF